MATKENDTEKKSELTDPNAEPALKADEKAAKVEEKNESPKKEESKEEKIGESQQSEESKEFEEDKPGIALNRQKYRARRIRASGTIQIQRGV
jgi:hypothetical protein